MNRRLEMEHLTKAELKQEIKLTQERIAGLDRKLTRLSDELRYRLIHDDDFGERLDHAIRETRRSTWRQHETPDEDPPAVA